MRGSFVLGIIGGIFAILIAFGIAIFGVFYGAFYGEADAAGQFYAQAGGGIVAGILSIIGGAIGKKLGGALMVIGSILAKLQTSIGRFAPMLGQGKTGRDRLSPWPALICVLVGR